MHVDFELLKEAVPGDGLFYVSRFGRSFIKLYCVHLKPVLQKISILGLLT